MKSTEKIDDMIASWDKAILPGYAWVFPLGDGEYNVGCGYLNKRDFKEKINLKVLYKKFCAEFPEMKVLMKGNQGESKMRGCQLRTNFNGVDPVGPGNTLVIGESIGTTYPFNGEGIGKAMETGELAAEILNRAFAEDDFTILKSFGDYIKQKIGFRYKGLEIAEKWMSYPWLNDLLARRVNKSSGFPALCRCRVIQDFKYIHLSTCGKMAGVKAAGGFT